MLIYSHSDIYDKREKKTKEGNYFILSDILFQEWTRKKDNSAGKLLVHSSQQS